MLLFSYMKSVRLSLILFVLFATSVQQSFAVVTTSTDNKISKYTCTNLTRVLQLGSKDTKNSNEVYKLRNFLKEDGDFVSNKIDTLGYFGSNTKAAVINFQKKHKIIRTGVVGQITRAKIKEISCVSTPLVVNKKISTNTAIAKATETAVTNIAKETPVIKEVQVVKETQTIFVKTLLASDITSNSASLNGSGGIDGQKHWFEWGRGENLGNVTSQVISSTTYSAKITGLTSGTTYYFRAVTSLATTTERKGETAYGSVRYFTTPAVSTASTPIVPTVSISSTQTAIDPSGAIKITWTSANTNICRFTGGEDGGSWTSQTSLSGFYITKPMTKEATFGIYCTSSTGNTVTGSVKVSKTIN